MAQAKDRAKGPAGSRLSATGKDGPQRVHTTGHRWSDEAEARFLDHLAASANITHAAREAGFSATLLYQKRRSDPVFAERWQAALAQGYARIEALLVRRATERLEGFAPDPDTPIPEMTVKDALAILGHHRAAVEGGPRSRRQWARPRSLDELRDSILAKLEAVAPEPLPLPQADSQADPQPDPKPDSGPGSDAA